MNSPFNQSNYRGFSVEDLVYTLHQYQDLKVDIDSNNDIYHLHSDYPVLLQEEIDAIHAEILRRRNAPFVVRANSPPELIEIIKGRVRIADIIEQYTEVLYSSKQQLKYRCNQHGDGNDKTPAGVIYISDNRYWCFVCNKGGDVFDAVQSFERVDLPTAIAKLARYIGIDTRPLVKPPVLHIKGGIPI